MSKKPFQHEIRIYWEDTDAGGIVFYANYLKFFERARTEWLRSFGIEQHSLLDETGGMFVVSATSIQYHRPARLDDRLLVSAAPLQIGRASIEIAQQAKLVQTNLVEKEIKNHTTENTVFNADQFPLLCEGTIRLGWVDAKTLRPSRIPASILEYLKS